MRGGGVEDDVDVENVSDNAIAIAKMEMAVMVPDDAAVLMTCDDEKCDLDDELKAALFVVKSFVASDLSGEHDEGVWGTDQQGGGTKGAAWGLLALVSFVCAVAPEFVP
jgi:hypothetical protein